MSVTLRDVAEQAGVSIGTASQALNNNAKVTADTRKKVIEAAYTVGYSMRKRVPNMSPVDKSISVIGVLAKHDAFDNLLTNPFYSHIYAGAEEECRQRGLSMMFSSVDVDPGNHPITWPPMINEGKIDGLLLVGTSLEKAAREVIDHIGVPVILIDSYAPDFLFDSIVTDNWGGAGKAVTHLIELGHTRIGLIGWNPSSPPSIQERMQGYTRTLQEHGLDAKIYIETSQLNREDGMRAYASLKTRQPDVTAVFVCNDETATGVVKEATDQGMRVPDDLSIIGFDNTYLSEGVRPALSTVHVHKKWMGALGVQFLLERAAFPGKPKVTTYIETELVVRQSTAAPRSTKIENFN